MSPAESIVNSDTLPAQAVVATGRNRVEFQPVRVPVLQPDEVVIQVDYSWISNGTETSFIKGERVGGDTPWQQGDPLPFPHVPGYQKCGVIRDVGTQVSTLEVGDRVFATLSLVEGMYFPNGGHVSPAVTPASQVWKLPATVSSLAASGLVLTQVGYNCGMRAPIHPGDAVIVLGDGLVGQWTAQTLAHRGARIILAGRHNDRLDFFNYGSQHIPVNTREVDLVEVARDWAPEGIQVIVDTVGALATMESLYPLMKSQGHLVSAGFYGLRGHIDIQAIRARELTLHAPSGWTKERMDSTLDLMAQDKLRTQHLITHQFPVAQAEVAYEMLLSRKQSVLGVVLDWNEAGPQS
jgi:2-desacetyl-2-hydroxyethyl bacteriochlorophyllide A dehydrogenase